MTITYFGYGSLVNVDTIPENTEVTPGRLDGWVREWKVCGEGANGRGRCALSVRKKDGVEIRGVMAREPRTRLAELEQREKRYFKVEDIGTSFRCEAEGIPGPEELFLFKASPEHRRWGSETHPILQSYLDCVLAGFFRLWGEEGIDHFLQTTDGWHVPVLKDRTSPHYPRSVNLVPELADLVDQKLREIGASFLSLDE
ncbi:MAG: gamma-glutamylcyclotransferase [Roseibium sp.]|uniref:gamma-glutamylcyclotransferase n=1 Tax=Roseibium sp. TaxID=1936156 RepID=UPI002638FDD2|nr:gamma-glutamylcyclotransferase [Roseibium sp.]MCV0429392.1 gamma-glutamylcyclotransferase [Roseibium sp.]